MYSIRTVTRRKPVAIRETNSCEVSDRLWFYMFILPVNVYKDISGDNDLKDLNTEFKPVLSV